MPLRTAGHLVTAHRAGCSHRYSHRASASTPARPPSSPVATTDSLHDAPSEVHPLHLPPHPDDRRAGAGRPDTVTAIGCWGVGVVPCVGRSVMRRGSAEDLVVAGASEDDEEALQRATQAGFCRWRVP